MSLQSALELIVGVDLGFTCTGVAFCTSERTYPKIVYEWPQSKVGLGQETSVYKVPTRVSYRAGREGFSWGFQCPLPGEAKHETSVKEHFKLYLDPEYLERAFKGDPDLAPGTIKDVQNWFRDFFSELCKHIECYFSDMFPEEWETGKVEYIFSVPTTWKKKPVIENFEEIVKKAGFGSKKNHSVTIGLSEAEAAAIYTAMYPSEHCMINKPEVGTEKDHRAALDAGTTTYEDVCVLEVKSTKGSPIELEQLSHVKGKPIGSVQIDNTFKGITEQRLNLIRDRLRNLELPVMPKKAARQMAQAGFQHHKVMCGMALTALETAPVRVPDLPSDFDSDQAEDIEGMFKEQIDGIAKLIDKQIAGLKKDCPSKELVREHPLGGSHTYRDQG
ncbi:hypothetical protein GP486_004627 [Trichoglossum hirsutum]|uniref:Uncharacterized protein n=1 Tax=Trichoglossum hirsutum TaxID=265104 RepID=A0A9P8LAU4_9PEZI|nr:hypothetical protein GP486_004627 [Trichoglossum hirsutum]